MEKREEDQNSNPRPDDFCNYVPWACRELHLDQDVYVNKKYQYDYASMTMSNRAKRIKSKSKLTVSPNDSEEKIDIDRSKIVKITAIYDIFDNLIELKFVKNKRIPRLIFKIIGLIIKFQKCFTKISIHGGLDMYGVYEINKYLTVSKITEICLDNSYLKEANYDILLGSSNALRHLSLSRCKIDDNIVRNITTKLTFPLPASATLIILNLSSNLITDVGAKYLAEVLRANRRLSYLNLAENRLTDAGLGWILDCLIEFPLTPEEVLAARSRHFQYLKENNLIADLKAEEFDRRPAIHKSVNIARKVTTRPANLNTIGELKDPFSTSNILTKEGVVYSKGCNTLCYLNVAYNNLTYLSLKKILKVLIFQMLLDRKPRGLINLRLEGNYMPGYCKEMTEIDDILQMGLSPYNSINSEVKKRKASRYSAR